MDWTEMSSKKGKSGAARTGMGQGMGRLARQGTGQSPRPLAPHGMGRRARAIGQLLSKLRFVCLRPTSGIPTTRQADKTKVPTIHAAAGLRATTVIAAVLAMASPWLSGASGCSNSGPSAQKSGTTTASTSTGGGGGGLVGGTLPDGSTVNAITLVNVAPSQNSADQYIIELYGQNGEMGTYCPTAADCQCRLRWTDVTTGNPIEDYATPTYVERDQVRCSYAVIPTNTPSFRVSLSVTSGGLSSNELSMSFPQVDSSADPTVASNYDRVIRYQCKDVLNVPVNATGFYKGLQDPQVWNLSYSYNLYTTALGADYGGGVASAGGMYECPTRPTDESVTKFSVGRYWPDVATAGLTSAAGPFGLDSRCGTDVTTVGYCPGLPADTTPSFTGTTAAAGFNNTTGEYTLRSTIFGAADVSTGAQLAATSTDTTSDDEPYDMALYSTAPLTGYDNVIYPVEVDRGTKTSLGNPNGTGCTTGTDSTQCTCVTGLEAGCRKFARNRHDFYLASFYSNTFKQPFCTPHTVGGAAGRNTVGATLDCTVDTSTVPVTRGLDVLGFAALPNSSGQCPNITLPAGKKWGLLWHFHVNLDARKTINITNPGDIGDLYCTRRDLECVDTSGAATPTSTASCNYLDGDCATTTFAYTGATPASTNGNNYGLLGPRYCTASNTVIANSDRWRVGVTQSSSNPGFRFGNCLETNEMLTDQQDRANFEADKTGAGNNALSDGWCSKTDGSAPFFINRDSTNRGDMGYSSSASWSLELPAAAMTDAAGCFDPMQLYQQGLTSEWVWNGALYLTGLINGFSSAQPSCYGFGGTRTSMRFIGYQGDSTTGSEAFTTSFSNQTFDWQGFPFIAADYTSINSGAPETFRGVGFGGNYCNPALPGSRWSQGTAAHDVTFGTQLNSATVGYGDGLDVWLVGAGSRHPCIEADVEASGSNPDLTTGFLYNQYARVNSNAPGGATAGFANGLNTWLRLPGTSTTYGDPGTEGYPGRVINFPKTIKNWFDFLGIGCDGKCDNSDASNSLPAISLWEPGKTRQKGLLNDVAAWITGVADNAFRSGPHSSTDSWGGYGVFQFGVIPIETMGPEDHLYVVSPQGITVNQMENDPATRDQYRPVRYIRGVKIQYDKIDEAANSTNPDDRLPRFPMCVLQDNGST